MEENNTPTPQVFDNPEDLAASMAQGTSEVTPEQPSEPVQESAPVSEPTPEPSTESTPYVDPEAAPVQEQLSTTLWLRLHQSLRTNSLRIHNKTLTIRS